MNSKHYVSLEVAKMLKEKGYDRECISYYHDNCTEVDYSFCGERNSTWEERCVSAPTKAEAIDWLDSKGKIIEVFQDYRGLWFYVIKISETESYVSESGDNYFPTRLEAEEAAIIKALEQL